MENAAGSSPEEDKFFDGVVDLEDYAAQGKRPPRARAYKIRINDDLFEWPNPVITGLEVLKLAGLAPPEQFTVRVKAKGEKPRKVQLDEEVDLRAPGVEKFRAIRKEQTEGEHQERREEFIAALTNAGHLAPGTDVSALKQKARETFTQRTREYIWENHANPLRRVVGSLPVDELAELAETLVSIESLKERVTRNTETVSGPIDVAIITKGDGFIWIKRKHYFDPDLNIRFVARKHAEIQEIGHGKKSGKSRKGAGA